MRRGARASIMYIMHVNGCRREEAREGRENWAEAASVYLAGITFEKKKAELLMGRRGWLLIDNLFGWRNFKLKMNLKLKSKLHKSWRDIIKFYLHLFTKKRLIVCAQYLKTTDILASGAGIKLRMRQWESNAPCACTNKIEKLVRMRQ